MEGEKVPVKRHNRYDTPNDANAALDKTDDLVLAHGLTIPQAGRFVKRNQRAGSINNVMGSGYTSRPQNTQSS